MITKVIIAEDHQIVNRSIQVATEDFGIKEVDHAFYCDEALQKIILKKDKGVSYDLLITDLYFESDNQVQQINGGAQLITAARKEQPDIRVLVFSAEGRPQVIEELFKDLKIDGFVRKARNDSKELELALQAISENKVYYPRQLLLSKQARNSFNFTDYDITIISLLAEGMRQKDIPDHLKNNDIKPSSMSSLEKRLNHIRESLEFTKNEQLVAYCKDMGII